MSPFWLLSFWSLLQKLKKSVFIFDGDETLFLSNWQYDGAFLEFFLYLNKIFRHRFPSLHPIYRKFFENHEQKNAQEFGVKKERIMHSMLDLYEEVCSHVDVEFRINFRRAEHIVRIREIAKMPFDYKRVEWLSGAEEVLRILKSKGHRLCLLSSYEKTVFSDKKDFLGLSRFFQEHNILPTEFAKTTEDFIKVSGWNEKTRDDFANWYTVGNGESDIKPAIEIPGWQGLYVRRASTSPFFENSSSDFLPPPMDDPRVVNLTNIRQILDYA